MERAQIRLQQLAAHLPPDEAAGSLSAMPCIGGFRRDNRVYFARAALNDARFMRPVQVTEVIKTEDVNAAPPPSLSGSSQEKFQKEDTIVDKIAPPLFSKPVPEEVGISEPLFARMSSLSAQELEKEKDAAALAWAGAEKQPAHPRRESIGFEWFPRMDVVESGTSYVITVELPGVSVDGICVMVDHDSLVITGNRSTDWWKHGNGNGHGNGGVYHRQELAQGPYRAVWRLPKTCDTSAITAEFIDGFLRVLVPKTRIIRYI